MPFVFKTAYKESKGSEKERNPYKIGGGFFSVQIVQAQIIKVNLKSMHGIIDKTEK